MKRIRSICGHAVTTTIGREWLSHRVNRFLYWHLALLALAGVAAVMLAPEDSERGVAWFLLNAVLYAVSLSSLLLGLSSAQAEADEMAFVATQPMGLTPWVMGKALGLVALVAPATFLLIVPAVAIDGFSSFLLGLAAASAIACVVLTLAGLAVGLWVRDPVRGLIGAIALWFLLLFVTDILLLLTAGSPWVHAHPSAWVVPLMLNPLDAFRVAVLFKIEQAAFSGMVTGSLTEWWIAHAGWWLGLNGAAWSGLAVFAAMRGARSRTEE